MTNSRVEHTGQGGSALAPSAGRIAATRSAHSNNAATGTRLCSLVSGGTVACFQVVAMRDRQRRRMADHPLENGRAQLVEVLVCAGAMLAALLTYLM